MSEAQRNEDPLDRRVMALVERLRKWPDLPGLNLDKDLMHEAADLLERVHSSLEFTRYWYITRHERLWQWAHAELNEQQRERYFSIVANGIADMNEPPTYAQQYNMMKHRMERAEAELAALRHNAKLSGRHEAQRSDGRA